MTFQSGDIVWTEDGRKALYVSAVGQQHAIRFAYGEYHAHNDGDEDEEYFSARIETVDRVFAVAPVAVIDAEIVKRQEKLDDLTKRALDKHRELAALECEQKDRMARLQMHEELRQLEAWLSGGITHFVTAGGYAPRIRVLTFDETLAIKSEYGDRRTGTAVLTLAVGWDKKLSWKKLERPTYEHLRPHTSLESAQAEARGLIAGLLESWERAKWKDVSAVQRLIEDATALGVPVPPAAAESVRSRVIEEARKHAEQKQNEAKLAMDRVAALMGESA